MNKQKENIENLCNGWDKKHIRQGDHINRAKVGDKSYMKPKGNHNTWGTEGMVGAAYKEIGKNKASGAGTNLHQCKQTFVKPS